MTTIPSPEQFLSQPSEPDEDLDPIDWQLEFDRRITELEDRIGRLQLEEQVLREQPTSACAVTAERDLIREHLADLEAKHQVLFELVEEIEALIKPSTSKLANSVRDAIGRWRNPETPSPAPDGPSSEPAVEDAAAAGNPQPDLQQVAGEGQPHNHAFERAEDGRLVCAVCGYSFEG